MACRGCKQRRAKIVKAVVRKLNRMRSALIRKKAAPK